MKKLFVFRGPPASGKGTLVTQFIKGLAGKVAHLELDTFRWHFHLVSREVTDVSEEEHMLAYQNYLSVLRNHLTDGSYTVVTKGFFHGRLLVHMAAFKTLSA